MRFRGLRTDSQLLVARNNRHRQQMHDRLVTCKRDTRRVNAYRQEPSLQNLTQLSLSSRCLSISDPTKSHGGLGGAIATLRSGRYRVLLVGC